MQAVASIVIPGLTRDPPFFATVAEGKWTPDQVRGDEYENANVRFRPIADIEAANSIFGKSESLSRKIGRKIRLVCQAVHNHRPVGFGNLIPSEYGSGLDMEQLA